MTRGAGSARGSTTSGATAPRGFDCGRGIGVNFERDQALPRLGWWTMRALPLDRDNNAALRIPNRPAGKPP
jgi:hypothetical protein